MALFQLLQEADSWLFLDTQPTGILTEDVVREGVARATAASQAPSFPTKELIPSQLRRVCQRLPCAGGIRSCGKIRRFRILEKKLLDSFGRRV